MQKTKVELSINAKMVLEKRYLLKDEKGEVKETPEEMFFRVARVVASADKHYNPPSKVEALKEEFYQVLANLEFLPNSPTLMNAGTEIGQLSACFVLPVYDSMESIFDTLKHMALIHQSGGGTGFSFSNLRPKDDVVKSTGGIASGPVSFMRVFDEATEIIKQGGRRRGANMGILRADHPDILEFIKAKEKEGFLTNFNTSVSLTDSFMEALEAGKEYNLVNPRTHQVVKVLPASEIFEQIVHTAWQVGDPGLIFIDEINRHNPTPHKGEIEGTNPCGEQPLLPYESCTLGSINLTTMVSGSSIDWEKLQRTVRTAIHFLDNVIEVNKFILPEVEAVTKGNRKIGLGVMGLAEMLIQLHLPYTSQEALNLADELMSVISHEAREQSAALARERGSFPYFKGSLWEKRGLSHLRNASLLTIAPTGTISIIAGTTSGIEPLFALSFYREVMDGVKLLEVNPIFKHQLQEDGLYSESLIKSLAQSGSIQQREDIPAHYKNIFQTAFDIPSLWHIKMQAAFQHHCDNAVSKTINLSPDTPPQEVKEAYLLAHQLKCKGITIYRYGTKKSQVLHLGETPGERGHPPYSKVDAEHTAECRECSF